MTIFAYLTLSFLSGQTILPLLWWRNVPVSVSKVNFDCASLHLSAPLLQAKRVPSVTLHPPERGCTQNRPSKLLIALTKRKATSIIQSVILNSDVLYRKLWTEKYFIAEGHRKGREKEGTNIWCKKGKVKDSREWREKYIIERRMSERDREGRHKYMMQEGQGKRKWSMEKKVHHRKKDVGKRKGRKPQIYDARSGRWLKVVNVRLAGLGPAGSRNIQWRMSYAKFLKKSVPICMQNFFKSRSVEKD